MSVVVVSLRVSTLASDAGIGSTELDLGPYANAGCKEIIGFWMPNMAGAASDTDWTFNNKFQESATTVASDFSDISGAAFTQVLKATTPALQVVKFKTMKRYIRSYAVVAGTSTPSVYDATGVVLEARFDT